MVETTFSESSWPSMQRRPTANRRQQQCRKYSFCWTFSAPDVSSPQANLNPIFTSRFVLFVSVCWHFTFRNSWPRRTSFFVDSVDNYISEEKNQAPQKPLIVRPRNGQQSALIQCERAVTSREKFGLAAQCHDLVTRLTACQDVVDVHLHLNMTTDLKLWSESLTF